jgi:hypothetical protein
MDDSIVIFLIVAFVVVILCWIFDRWITPGQARRNVKKLLAKVRSGEPEQPKKFIMEISFDPNGFSVGPVRKEDVSPVGMKWTDVQRVIAFKEDWLTVDCICLAFVDRDDHAIQVHEEMKGWQELVEALPESLPGCKPWSEWFTEVSFPAFATNLIQLFDRGKTETKATP